jgi:PAS domain S-box-containing protein
MERRTVSEHMRGEVTSAGDHASRFRSMVEGVVDYAILMLDVDGRVTSWSAGAEQIEGYQPEEIIGQHVSVFYPTSDIAAQKPQQELAQAAAEGRFEDEGWRVRKDGTRFWANVVITALRRQGGELSGYGTVTRDLSERRNAELRLQASEESFRLLVAGVVDYAIVMLDVEGRIETWNAGAEQIEGYRTDEIIGAHFSVFYTPEDLAARKPEYELTAAAANGRFEDEGWRVRKDGSRFWANVVITALRNDDGELRGFAKVARDLTERRAAELRQQASNDVMIASAEHRRALRQGHDELRSIIDTLPASVWVSNPAGELILSNRAFDEASVTSSFAANPLGAGEASPSRREEAFVDELGRERTVVVARSLLRDETGAVYAVCGVATDITDRREIQRESGELVWVVSHELRAPLTDIRAALGVLADERELDAASQRRMIEIALSGSERLTDLIDDTSSSNVSNRDTASAAARGASPR